MLLPEALHLEIKRLSLASLLLLWSASTLPSPISRRLVILLKLKYQDVWNSRKPYQCAETWRGDFSISFYLK